MTAAHYIAAIVAAHVLLSIGFGFGFWARGYLETRYMEQPE